MKTNGWHLPRAAALVLAAACAQAAPPAGCDATPVAGGGKNVQAYRLVDRSVAAYSGMNINVDGYARAYHRRNRDAGAVLHLCVGGRVWLPNGSSYEGSASSATCTGRFMDDLARIEAAGWADPTVGVVEWYGVLAEGDVRIGGRTIKGVKPMLQRDGSGFYVSPTTLFDKSITDGADQRRYVNPLRVPAAVVPGALAKSGIAVGSYGVAVHVKKQIAVPFVVGDLGPRVGEGSPALARRVSGLPPSATIDLKNRYAGQVDPAEVLWVFFGGPAAPFSHEKEAEAAQLANTAFEKWGGEARLASCRAALPRP